MGIGKVPGHQGPGLTCADYQDRVPLHAIQDFLGHLHGRMGHRDRAPPNLRFGLSPFSDMHRRVEETRQEGAGGPMPISDLVGTPDLTKNLGLPNH